MNFLKANKWKNKEEGITLVALVVTVVVLIILAGVSLGLAMSNGGLVQKTNKSAKQYNQSKIEEKFDLILANYKIEKGPNDSANLYEMLLKEKQNGNLEEVEKQADESIIMIDSDFQMTVDKDGNVIEAIREMSPRIITGKAQITRNNTEVEDASLNAGDTVDIKFDASLKNGTVTVTPSLPYTTADFETTFHIAGTSGGKSYSKDVVISTKSKYNAETVKIYEAGFGNASSGEITSGKTLNVANNTDVVKLQTKNFNLPTGETLTTDKPCAGLYIISQGDIIINGTIDMTGKGYYTENAPSSTTVSKKNITLAIGGAGGNSKSGNGGRAACDSAGMSGGSGAIAYGTAGNHTCGGYGNRVTTSGGTGGYGSWYYRSHSGSSASPAYETGHCTAGAGTIVLIAKGKIEINGSIISNGANATASGGNGGSAWGQQQAGQNIANGGGNGGNSGKGGDGGGAVTIIYGDTYTNNGTISLNGGASAGNGTNGGNIYRKSDEFGNGGTGGTSGTGGNGNIVTQKVGITE